MSKKIKLLCLTLVLAFVASIVPVSAASYADVYDYDSYKGAVERLRSLDIINGYTDGTFRPSDTLTRAQFSKIIVCALDKEDEAKASGTSSTFYDVGQDYWGTPYINYISKNKVIIGYSDGSFRPEKPITYAEAITVLIRILGYSESSVGYFWPNNYIDKAAALEITDGFSIGANDTINRAIAAVLIDNVLFTEINGASAAGESPQTSASPGTGSASGTSNILSNTKSGKILLESVGYTIIKDAIVLSTSNDDSNIPVNNIKLSDNSIYESRTGETFQSAALLKYVVLDEDNFIVAVKDNLTGDAAAQEMRDLGYTVLTNCHIIATSADDKTLSNNQIRTSAGVYTVQGTDVSTEIGEVGTIILNKEKKVISTGTHEAPYQEYMISEVTDNKIEYVTNNTLQTLNLSDDFPIYVDYGTKKNFSDARKDFVSSAELTMYRSVDTGDWEFGVLDTNSGYSILNDCFIAASKNEDKSLASDQVRTSNGVYKVTNTDILSNVGSIGTVVINSSNKIEQYAPTNMVSINVVVNKVNGDEIEYLGTNGTKGTFKFDNTFAAYVDYSKTTYSMAKSSISSGTELTFYGTTQGDWEFVVVGISDDIKPILATKDYTADDTSLEGTAINKENLTVYRAGEAATLADIKKNDVIYYNTKTNIMDVYNKKVTGIYYDAKPSKAYITSITVGGVDYTIGTTAATAKLDASAGSYAIGDKVTLLLGKNDEVVFVVELTDFDFFDYGVVLNTYSKVIETGDNKGKSEIRAKVYMPDGNTYEYVTDKDYSIYKGVLVYMTYADGKVSMSRATSSNVYGEIDKKSRTVNGKELAKESVIMQLVSNEDGVDAVVELLNFDTLDASEIRSGQLLNSINANKFGDIGIMYVQGLTDTGYQYAMAVSISNGYKLYLNGETKTYQADSNFNIMSGGPVAVKFSGEKITDLYNLYRYKTASSIDAIEGSRIMLNDKVYKLAPEVVIYAYDNHTYSEMTFDEVENANISSVSIYSDKSISNDGQIKVILVQTK